MKDVTIVSHVVFVSLWRCRVATALFSRGVDRFGCRQEPDGFEIGDGAGDVGILATHVVKIGVDAAARFWRPRHPAALVFCPFPRHTEVV